MVVMPAAVYAQTVEGTAAGESPHQGLPRIVVVRALADAKAAVAMAAAGVAVLFVLRCADAERQRVVDFLAGWSAGSGGNLDRISSNTVAARPPGALPVRVGRTGVVSALDDVFHPDIDGRLTRADENRLLPLAAAGSVEARRRLTDAYAELATVVAMWLRPPHTSAVAATAAAQEELDRLVAWPPIDGVMLTALVDGIKARLLG